MGTDKLLLHWQGKPILAHTIEALLHSKVTDTIVVVPSIDHARSLLAQQYNIRVLPCLQSSLGMGHSLAHAVASVAQHADAIIVTLGDQPNIAPDDIDRTIAQYRCAAGAPIIVQTSYAHGGHGHPVLFSRAFFTELSQLHGDRGAKSLLRTHATAVRTIYSWRPYLADIDTPADYTRFAQLHHAKDEQLHERLTPHHTIRT